MTKGKPPKVRKGKDLAPKWGVGAVATRQRRKAADTTKEEAGTVWRYRREAARQELEDSLEKYNKKNAVDAERTAQILLGTTIANQTSVLRSFGLSQNVNATMSFGERIIAYTDFKRIVVQMPHTMMPANFNDGTAVVGTIAVIKGVFQHEMAHLRFTYSWANVIDDILLGLIVITSMQPPAKDMQTVWNMLEDQRIETKSVEEIPRLKNYFTPTVINACLGQTGSTRRPLNTAWTLIAGRQYLPHNLRVMAYDLFNTACADKGVTDGSQKWGTIVRKYIGASTTQEIYDTVCEAYAFLAALDNIPPDGQEGRAGDGNGTSSGNPTRGASKQADDIGDRELRPRTDKPLRPENGKPENGKEGDGDGGGDPTDEKSGKKGDSTHKDHYADRHVIPEGLQGQMPDQGKADWTGGQSNHGQGMRFTATDFEGVLTSAVEEAQQLARADSDTLRIAAEVFSLAAEVGLPEYFGETVAMSAEHIAEANTVAAGIEAALETFVTDTLPVWRTRVEEGFIDPLAYRTREIGSRDYRRFYDDHGNTGLDLHVSILADVSYSMGPHMLPLSKFLYASSVACQALGIPTTFTLWSSSMQNFRIWGQGSVPVVFPEMGGTDPTEALDDLVNHNKDEKRNHLVLVFTDGEWAHEFPPLTKWADKGRTFMFIRYDPYTSEGKTLKDMGADHHIAVKSLSALPKALTDGLIAVLS